MGKVIQLFDGLRNALLGTGTGHDPRTANTYVTSACLTQQQIADAYRGSGLMRKIIDIPALDMVREWRDWKLDADEITQVEAEEKRLGLRGKVRLAETLRGLGGGALVLGLPGDPSQPAPKAGRGALAFIHVVSRWHLQFDELNEYATDAGYGEPVMWRMMQSGGGEVRLHPSRVIPFRAETAGVLAGGALAASPDDVFWGESRVSQVLDAVQDCDLARASFATLINKASKTRVGIPGLMEMAASSEGTDAVQKRVALMVMAEGIHNATVYDAGDSEGKGGEVITDASYTFAGMKDVFNAYAEFVCAISDIPATRLLGRAPEGMNSSGDGQQTDWRKKVRAMQTLDLAPCLDRLDTYLLPSAIGSMPDGQWYDFAPLDTPDEKENADRFLVQMQAAEKLQMLGSVPEQAFNRGLQSLLIDEGYMPELESALAEIPDDERFGVITDPELETRGGDPNLAAAVGDPESLQSVSMDALPRTLYVRRNLINADEFIAWAKSQGFETTTPADELHVTIAYSRQPVDWLKIENAWEGEDGRLTVAPGGARLVEPLGDKGAVVLLFNSSPLSWRHEAIKQAGASFDFDEYQPHVTITYQGGVVDLSEVEPYRGKLEFGPEIFEELDEDWASKLTKS